MQSTNVGAFFVCFLAFLVAGVAAADIPCPAELETASIHLDNGESTFTSCDRDTLAIVFTAKPGATKLRISGSIRVASIEFRNGFADDFELTIVGTKSTPIQIANAGAVGIRFTNVAMTGGKISISYVEYNKGVSDAGMALTLRGRNSRFTRTTITASNLVANFCSEDQPCAIYNHGLLELSFAERGTAIFTQSTLTIRDSSFSSYGNDVTMARLAGGTFDRASALQFDNVNVKVRAAGTFNAIYHHDMSFLANSALRVTDMSLDVQTNAGDCRFYFITHFNEDIGARFRDSTLSVEASTIDMRIPSTVDEPFSAHGFLWNTATIAKSQISLRNSIFHIGSSQRWKKSSQTKSSLMYIPTATMSEVFISLVNVDAQMHGPDPTGIVLLNGNVSQLSIAVSKSKLYARRRCFTSETENPCQPKASGSSSVKAGSALAVISLSQTFVSVSELTVQDSELHGDAAGGLPRGIFLAKLYEVPHEFVQQPALQVKFLESDVIAEGQVDVAILHTNAYLPNGTLVLRNATLDARVPEGSSLGTDCIGYSSRYCGFQKTSIDVFVKASEGCFTALIADIRLNGTTTTTFEVEFEGMVTAHNEVMTETKGFELTYANDATAVPSTVTFTGIVDFPLAESPIMVVATPDGALPVGSPMEMDFLDLQMNKSYPPLQFQYLDGEEIETEIIGNAPTVKLQCSFYSRRKLLSPANFDLLPQKQITYGPNSYEQQVQSLCPIPTTNTTTITLPTTPTSSPSATEPLRPPTQSATPSSQGTATSSLSATPSLPITTTESLSRVLKGFTCDHLTITLQLLGPSSSLNVTEEVDMAIAGMDQPVASVSSSAGENPTINIPFDLIKSGFALRLVATGNFSVGGRTGAIFPAHWNAGSVRGSLKTGCLNRADEGKPCRDAKASNLIWPSLSFVTPMALPLTMPAAPSFIDGGDVGLTVSGGALSCMLSQDITFTLAYQEEPIDDALGAAAADGLIGAGIVSSAAAPGVAMDAQALAVFSLISCSSRGSRYSMKKTQFLLAPYSIGPEPEGLIVFNVVVLVCFAALQLSVACLLKMTGWRAVTNWSQALAQARFPSIFFSVSMLVQQGNAILALRLVIDGIPTFFAWVALGYSVAFPVIIFFLYRAKTNPELTSSNPSVERLAFFRYESTVASGWPKYSFFNGLKWLLVPCGRWGPLPMRQRYGSMVAPLKPTWLRFAGAPLLQANAVAILAAVNGTGEKWQCGLQYGVLIAMYFALSLTVAVVQPYRSRFENFAGASSYFLLGMILIIAMVMALDPTNPIGRQAQGVLLLLQMFFSILRTIYMISIRVLERIFWRTESGKAIWSSSRDDFSTRTLFRQLLDMEEVSLGDEEEQRRLQGADIGSDDLSEEMLPRRRSDDSSDSRDVAALSLNSMPAHNGNKKRLSDGGQSSGVLNGTMMDKSTDSALAEISHVLGEGDDNRQISSSGRNDTTFLTVERPPDLSASLSHAPSSMHFLPNEGRENSNSGGILAERSDSSDSNSEGRK